MVDGKFRISGTGCALADFLFTGIRFLDTSFQKFCSLKPGDGGLSPGKLVFTEELEQFSNTAYTGIFAEITRGKSPDTINVGGPGLVSLIHVSQMLDQEDFIVSFYGGTGRDKTAEFIFSLLDKTALNRSHYRAVSDRPTPFTHVLSDETYDDQHGERTFINNIGAALDFTTEHLDEDFFRSDIVCFGGTALVPDIHDNLTDLLRRAKHHGGVTVVNTVFDFRNEKQNPKLPWPLGETETSLELTDLLIMDREESLRISGCNNIEDAAHFFARSRVGAFMITNGKENLVACSKGKLFEPTDLISLPVSTKIAELIRTHPEMRGDTTGCGDNFAGGAIASCADQLRKGRPGPLDFKEAISWAVASGGYSCFYLGGTYLEGKPGEKRAAVNKWVRDYRLAQQWEQ